MSYLAIRDLTPQRFDEALALARAIEPRLTRATWRRYLKGLRQRDAGGLMAVENERGVLLALAAYRTRAMPAGEISLDCDPVAVFDLVGAPAVTAALVQALEQRAGELGCAFIHTHLLGDERGLADTSLLRGFRAQGHEIEATRLCKRLSSGSPAEESPLGACPVGEITVGD